MIALFVVIEIECDTPNKDLPVVALLALADHVKLGLLPRSHKVVAFNKCNSLCAAIEFTLKVGEIIVLHPLLYITVVHILRTSKVFECTSTSMMISWCARARITGRR